MINPELYENVYAIGPAIGDAVYSAFPGEGTGAFYAIFNGGILNANYTREGDGYSKNELEEIIISPQDSPMFEYITTSGVTNLVLINGVPQPSEATTETYAVGFIAETSQIGIEYTDPSFPAIAAVRYSVGKRLKIDNSEALVYNITAYSLYSTGGKDYVLLTFGGTITEVPTQVGWYDDILTNMTVVGTGATLSIVRESDGLDYYRVVTTAGAVYVDFAGEVGTTDECMMSMWCSTSTATGAFLASDDGLVIDILTGEPARRNQTFTPSGTTVKMRVRCENNTTTIFRLPQITVGSDLEVDVPSLTTGPTSAGGSTYKAYLNYADPNEPSGFPAGVNQPALSILAEDIETASYLFDSAQSDCVDRVALSEISESSPWTVCIKIKTGSDVTTSQCIWSNNISTSDFSGLMIRNTVLRAGVFTTAYEKKSSGAISINTEYSVVVTNDSGQDDIKLYLDTIEQAGTSDPTLSASSTGFSLGATTAGVLNLDGNEWLPLVYDRVLSTQEITDYQNGLVPSGPILQPDFHSYRRDTYVKDLSASGYDLTASRAINLLISENDAFGYPVNEKAKLPWRSSLGTAYGIEGLFEGVDSNPATGRMIFENFTLHELGTLIPLASDSTGATNYIWIDTSGVITVSNGTNTAYAPSALVAGTTYNFIVTWDTDEMFVTVGETSGTKATFTGAFQAIGNRLLYALDSSIYHTVQNVYFDDEML